MECATDTTKSQQEDGSFRRVEIVPEGCYPVSEEMCMSGYMAPAKNVTFPENSLKQCCKCKAGEDCPLCADPTACTDDEKEKYVTSENCFGEGSVFDSSTGPSPGPSADKKDEDEDDSIVMYIIIGSVVLVA